MKWFNQERKKAIPVTVLVVSWVLFCWLAMQLIHETGHLLAAHWFDVEVVRFHFGLLTISHTMLDDSGQTATTLLAVTWAGPVVGMLLPLVFWGTAAVLRCRETFLLRFLAGSCLVANGCYLLFGPSDGFADTGILLAHGAARWQLITVGLIGVVGGFFTWNNQGHDFGIGKNPKPVTKRSLCFSLVALGGMILFCIIVGFADT